MKYFIYKTRQYEKSIKKLVFNKVVVLQEVENVIDKIASNERLEDKLRDHKLQGEMKDFRECHIKPDVLLIYKIEKEKVVLILINIGSHSELFG